MVQAALQPSPLRCASRFSLGPLLGAQRAKRFLIRVLAVLLGIEHGFLVARVAVGPDRMAENLEGWFVMW